MPLTVPGPLIGALQAAFVSQGFPASTIADDGTINPVALLSAVYDTVEFRSNFTPPVKISIADVKLGGSPSMSARIIQPAVIVSGQAGTTEIAPFGVPNPITGIITPIFIFGGVFLLGAAWGAHRRNKRG